MTAYTHTHTHTQNYFWLFVVIFVLGCVFVYFEGGYNPNEDLVLLLDVARFKYPPHWVPLKLLYQSMLYLDQTTQKTRGWMLCKPAPKIQSLFFDLNTANAQTKQQLFLIPKVNWVGCFCFPVCVFVCVCVFWHKILTNMVFFVCVCVFFCKDIL